MIMTAVVVGGVVGLLLMLVGGLVGAQLQDWVHEDQRRRMAARQHQLNMALRSLRDLSRRDAVGPLGVACWPHVDATSIDQEEMD
jgi:hypothetical protein